MTHRLLLVEAKHARRLFVPHVDLAVDVDAEDGHIRCIDHPPKIIGHMLRGNHGVVQLRDVGPHEHDAIGRASRIRPRVGIQQSRVPLASWRGQHHLEASHFDAFLGFIHRLHVKVTILRRHEDVNKCLSAGFCGRAAPQIRALVIPIRDLVIEVHGNNQCVCTFQKLRHVFVGRPGFGVQCLEGISTATLSASPAIGIALGLRVLEEVDSEHGRQSTWHGTNNIV
mmetsp:Transcript_99009/g.256009  ORF Transcript_99009/g.256009 Transcript_99009/m.256009 type:complete len:226 (+) Transcript_99009:673-1350(+)